MEIDYSDINSILAGINAILNLQNFGGPPPVPSPLIELGVPTRTGLSPTKIASNIIARKSEAGLPVGVLPSGGAAPDEIMERIRIEEIVKSLLGDAVITIVLPPGVTVTAAGASPSGPVTVFGSTITIAQGYAIIQ